MSKLYSLSYTGTLVPFTYYGGNPCTCCGMTWNAKPPKNLRGSGLGIRLLPGHISEEKEILSKHLRHVIKHLRTRAGDFTLITGHQRV